MYDKCWTFRFRFSFACELKWKWNLEITQPFGKTSARSDDRTWHTLHRKIWILQPYLRWPFGACWALTFHLLYIARNTPISTPDDPKSRMDDSWRCRQRGKSRRRVFAHSFLHSIILSKRFWACVTGRMESARPPGILWGWRDQHVRI